MGSDAEHLNDAVLVANDDDEPELVAADVKDDTVLGKDAGGGVAILHILSGLPCVGLGFSQPCGERSFGLRVFTREFIQYDGAYDSHP